MIYLQPFQEFEVEDRSIGHICQRIISEEVATDMIKSATEVSQGGGMNEVIASSSAAFAIEIWEKHADCTKQFSNTFVFRSLSSLCFQLSRILNEEGSSFTDNRFKNGTCIFCNLPIISSSHFTLLPLAHGIICDVLFVTVVGPPTFGHSRHIRKIPLFLIL